MLSNDPCFTILPFFMMAMLSHIVSTSPSRWLFRKIVFPAAFKRSRQVSDRLVKGVGFLMKKNKIDVYDGTGTLTGPNAIAVKLNDGKEATLEAKNIIIATGARPRPFPGVDFDEIKSRLRHEIDRLREDITTLMERAVDAGSEVAHDDSDAMVIAGERNFVGLPDFSDNMNRLKAGAVLSVPSTEEAGRVTPGEAREVIVARSDLGRSSRRLLVDHLLAQGLTVKMAPPPGEFMDGELKLTELRAIKVEDLLGRDPVPPDRFLSRARRCRGPAGGAGLRRPLGQRDGKAGGSRGPVRAGQGPQSRGDHQGRSQAFGRRRRWQAGAGPGGWAQCGEAG